MKTNLLSYCAHNVRQANSSRAETGQTVLSRLNCLSQLALLLACMLLGSPRALGSDPIGIFAKIDKVVLEPTEAAPERIQIWGTFCFADGKFGDQYASPKTGRLYYKLPAEKPEVARKEWADLKSVAGKREVIGFGTRYGEKGRIRKPDENAENPDVYPVGWGLARMKDRKSDYEPIKQLLAAPSAVKPTKSN